VPALVTPFRADERIDFGLWQKVIDAHLAAGVNGLFCGGSSGEFYSLDTEERHVSLRFCQQAAAGRVPVYGNVGCITTRQTIRMAQAAEAEGIDVLVVVAPYYLKPSQDEIAAHYIDICRAVRSPVLAYNFPQHGGVEILPETLGRVAAGCDNLVGVKDSGGNLEQTVAYRTCAPGRELAVFVGPEKLILACLERGCAGTVTAFSNVAPRLFTDLYRAFRAGNRTEAERLQGIIAELTDTVTLHTFPGVIKEAMELAGLPGGNCRRPIGQMPREARARLAAAIARLREEGYSHEPVGRRTEPVSAPARP
jgi:4-hydroxy-tetrahydrodipicolinate synthase